PPPRAARRPYTTLFRSQEQHADVDAELDALRDRLDDAEVAYDVRQLGRGNDVASDLVETAEETGAELIVIGLRRRSPVGKLILRSEEHTSELQSRFDLV